MNIVSSLEITARGKHKILRLHHEWTSVSTTAQMYTSHQTNVLIQFKLAVNRYNRLIVAKVMDNKWRVPCWIDTVAPSRRESQGGTSDVHKILASGAGCCAALCLCCEIRERESGKARPVVTLSSTKSLSWEWQHSPPARPQPRTPGSQSQTGIASFSENRSSRY